MNDREILGEASVQYNDMKGTVAIDGPDHSERLYALAGLSRDEWFILGYDIYGGYGRTYASVWVLGRDVAPNGWDDFVRLAKENKGVVPTHKVEIVLDDGREPGIELLTLNKRWSIHATQRGLLEEGFTLERIAND